MDRPTIAPDIVRSNQEKPQLREQLLAARAALGKEGQDEFYASKLGTARFYFARLLPRIHSLSTSIKAGSESLYLLDAAQF